MRFFIASVHITQWTCSNVVNDLPMFVLRFRVFRTLLRCLIFSFFSFVSLSRWLELRNFIEFKRTLRTEQNCEPIDVIAFEGAFLSCAGQTIANNVKIIIHGNFFAILSRSFANQQKSSVVELLLYVLFGESSLMVIMIMMMMVVDDEVLQPSNDKNWRS